jgi:pimeloyl-ACP methyl ester carboxylesterase
VIQGARSVSASDVDVAVCVRGSGPPVLLLHGIPDTQALWDATVERLADRCCCITMDLPDFGGSRIQTRGEWAWTLSQRGALIERVLDGVGVNEAVTIVAHNAGGTFAIPFVGRHPHRYRAGLFCTTSMHPNFTWHPFAELCRTPEVGEQVMSAYTSEVFTSGVRAFSGDALPQAHIDTTFERVDDRMRAAILAFYRATNPTEFAPFQAAFERATLTKPLRVIWGALNPGAGESMAIQSFPGADMSLYPDVGHWPMVEAEQRWLHDVDTWVSSVHAA